MLGRVNNLLVYNSDMYESKSKSMWRWERNEQIIRQLKKYRNELNLTQDDLIKLADTFHISLGNLIFGKDADALVNSEEFVFDPRKNVTSEDMEKWTSGTLWQILVDNHYYFRCFDNTISITLLDEIFPY